MIFPDYRRSAKYLALGIGLFTLFLSRPVAAQLIPDVNWGESASRIRPEILDQQTIDLIEGGVQRGGNLFHSFVQFNIDTNQRVYFASPNSTQNIFTRVTGGTSSNIQGVLGVAGNANLFLLNPAGMLFGPNAQLDVRGSFIGTTASAVEFGDQGSFVVTQPNAPPLLTIQPSALQFAQAAASPIDLFRNK
jgi:filamentous hemagglutinin family protein